MKLTWNSFRHQMIVMEAGRNGVEDYGGIQKEIFETIQCTATVGVASNKLLAKLPANQAKLNKSMVVKDHHALLEPLKLRDLHGIGYSMERKLTAESLISVRNVWELGHTKSELIHRFFLLDGFFI
jgi:nucleotidyltransferase/DNA polymerase involved in DNA repair